MLKRRAIWVHAAVVALGVVLLPKAMAGAASPPRAPTCEFLLAGVRWIELRQLASDLKQLQPLPGVVEVTGGLRLAQAKDALLVDPLFPMTRAEIDKLTLYEVREGIRRLVENTATYWASSPGGPPPGGGTPPLAAKVSVLTEDQKRATITRFVNVQRGLASSGQHTRAVAALSPDASLPQSLDAFEGLLLAQIQDRLPVGPKTPKVDSLTPLGLRKELERSGCAPK